MWPYTVYDKAKYHFDGDFPADLDRRQAYVHIGMFLGWACANDLLSEEFQERFAREISAFKQKQLTGPQLLWESGGELTSECLSEEGNAFAESYFTYGRGQYLNDYHRALAKGLPSPYCVEDTWENFDVLCARIDERYNKWCGRQLTLLPKQSGPMSAG